MASRLSAIAKAAGPACIGTVYSIGIKMGYVILPWWTLAAVAALSTLPVFWVVETEGFGGGECQDNNSKTVDEGNGDAGDDKRHGPKIDERDTRKSEHPHQNASRAISKSAATGCTAVVDELENNTGNISGSKILTMMNGYAEATGDVPVISSPTRTAGSGG